MRQCWRTNAYHALSRSHSELKTVYDEHFKAEFPVPPLSLEGAKLLEIRTSMSPDMLLSKMAPSSKSDYVAVKSQARAVLS